MTTEPGVSLVKTSDETVVGPVWITVPARVIALVIVLPVRAGYDLAQAAGRRLMTGLRRIGRGARRMLRAMGTTGRWTWDTFIVVPAIALWPAVRWIFKGVAWLSKVCLVDPAALVLTVVVVRPSRAISRSAGRIGRWFYRAALTPTGHGLLAAGRVLGGALVRGAAFVGSAGALLLEWAVLYPLRLLGRGLRWVLTPPLVAMVWLLRAIGAALLFVGRPVWKVVSTTWLGVLAGLGWAWDATGRLLKLLFRTLVLTPASVIWMYVLVPVRWAWHAVLRPVRQAIRHAWQISIRRPLRQARVTIQTTIAQTRQELRMRFHEIFRRASKKESAHLK